ncbi:MAG: FAD-binding oxidoreductase [Acidobacteriaceae bacterium]|nr:FAD-binding oxidoreductase [Acidobacteriaceae bacterium]MBV9780199.1 FAD-binding oxidoreductase [Acidobacteriaceae bacterium]
MISPAAISRFKEEFRGELVLPGDADYDQTRTVYNRMIDRRPAMIACCAVAADVVTCIHFAREHDLEVSVRGGGHSVAGKAVCDGGLVIDVSEMKGIDVDPVKRVARAQPGLRLGEFDRETQAHGLATTLGIVSDTGISGLTLGGGIGWLNGKYGLACDNVLCFQVATADGQLWRASADENADLYWALRGGSGNFGIVTSFKYQLHAVGPVLAGMTVYPHAQAASVLRFYLEFAAACPDELSTALAMLCLPDGTPIVSIVVCYCGDLREGEQAVKALRSFGTPMLDSIQPMDYVPLQSILDAAFPRGQQHYWKSNFARTLTGDAIGILVEGMSRKPSPLTIAYLQQMHGVAGRVPASATAFPHRGDHFDFSLLSQWSDLAASEANLAWTRELYDVLRPHLEDAVYVNNLGEEGGDRVRAAYGPNYDRLVKIKTKYDPTNFFYLNQNIAPRTIDAATRPS